MSHHQYNTEELNQISSPLRCVQIILLLILTWICHSALAKRITPQSKPVYDMISTCYYMLYLLTLYRDDAETSPQNEIKYLVFHTHLLSLFTQCRSSCHLSCIGRISDKKGTLLLLRSVSNVTTSGLGEAIHLSVTHLLEIYCCQHPSYLVVPLLPKCFIFLIT